MLRKKKIGPSDLCCVAQKTENGCDGALYFRVLFEQFSRKLAADNLGAQKRVSFVLCFSKYVYWYPRITKIPDQFSYGSSSVKWPKRRTYTVVRDRKPYVCVCVRVLIQGTDDADDAIASRCWDSLGYHPKLARHWHKSSQAQNLQDTVGAQN